MCKKLFEKINCRVNMVWCLIIRFLVSCLLELVCCIVRIVLIGVIVWLLVLINFLLVFWFWLRLDSGFIEGFLVLFVM